MTTCGRLPAYGTRVTTYKQSYQIQLKTSVLTLLRYIYLRALIYLLYLREYIPLTSHVPLTPYFILPALFHRARGNVQATKPATKTTCSRGEKTKQTTTHATRSVLELLEFQGIPLAVLHVKEI